MSNEERMGKIAEQQLFRNFFKRRDPDCIIEYHHNKYALYWDAKVYTKGKWFFFQIKTGAPFVTERAGVLHLSQQKNYIDFMADPTIDGGQPDSEFFLISFPVEGTPKTERYNEEIRKSWLGNVYILKPSVMKNADENKFRIQDKKTKRARYVIPYEGNYKCISKDLHTWPENIKIYQKLKSLSASEF